MKEDRSEMIKNVKYALALNAVYIVAELFFALIMHAGIEKDLAPRIVLVLHICSSIQAVEIYFTRENYCGSLCYKRVYGIICLLSNLIPLTVLTAVEIIVFHIGGPIGTLLMAGTTMYLIISSAILLIEFRW